MAVQDVPVHTESSHSRCVAAEQLLPRLRHLVSQIMYVVISMIHRSVLQAQ